jgi:hypothetical protein
MRVLRARRDELDLPHEIIDDVAGFTAGHTAKLLSTDAMGRPRKGLGRVSWNIFEGLGLRVTVLEDPDALARAKRRSAWRTRRQGQPLPVTTYKPAA